MRNGKRVEIQESEEPASRFDIAILWLSRISTFLAFSLVAGSIGFLQGAQYVAEEATARFDCVAKP